MRAGLTFLASSPPLLTLRMPPGNVLLHLPLSLTPLISPLPSHRAPPGAGFGYYTYRGSYPRYDDPYDEDGDEYATYSDDEYY